MAGADDAVADNRVFIEADYASVAGTNRHAVEKDAGAVETEGDRAGRRGLLLHASPSRIGVKSVEAFGGACLTLHGVVRRAGAANFDVAADADAGGNLVEGVGELHTAAVLGGGDGLVDGVRGGLPGRVGEGGGGAARPGEDLARRDIDEVGDGAGHGLAAGGRADGDGVTAGSRPDAVRDGA